MLQWFWQSGNGNACWSACCLPGERGWGKWEKGIRLKEVWQLEPLCDGRLMGKRHFQSPSTNLLIINQLGEMAHKKNHTFYSKGHLNRNNRFSTLSSLLPPPLVENTPVSIRLKEVLLMLHLSLPIVNSVDPSRSEWRRPRLFICLFPFFFFVHTCRPGCRERNECLWVIRPVGQEEEEGGEEKKVGEGEWLRETDVFCCVDNSGMKTHTEKSQIGDSRRNSKSGCKILADIINNLRAALQRTAQPEINRIRYPPFKVFLLFPHSWIKPVKTDTWHMERQTDKSPLCCLVSHMLTGSLDERGVRQADVNKTNHSQGSIYFCCTAQSPHCWS